VGHHHPTEIPGAAEPPDLDVAAISHAGSILKRPFQYDVIGAVPTTTAPSPRHDELLERSYRYVLEHGLAGLSLRPLAAAVGSSPRVLLFLFGSKEELIRAVLARARADEVRILEASRARSGGDLRDAARAVWTWLVDDTHRPLLVLWLEVYARSLTEASGPWHGFAAQTVDDWLGLLAATQPRAESRKGTAERTLCLAVLRGALLDLLATGDVDRVSAAVDLYLDNLE
jgi:AcrR family transcriptional regulator